MQAERFYRRPVIPLTVALMIGIALARRLREYGSGALVLAWRAALVWSAA